MKTTLLFFILLACKACCTPVGGRIDLSENKTHELKMIKTRFDKYILLIEQGRIRRKMSLRELQQLAGNELVIRSNHTAFIVLSQWDMRDYNQSPPVWQLEFTFDEDNILSSYFIHIPVGK